MEKKKDPKKFELKRVELRRLTVADLAEVNGAGTRVFSYKGIHKTKLEEEQLE